MRARLIPLTAVLCLAAASALHAQDPDDPPEDPPPPPPPAADTRVILENDRVLVVEQVYEPGAVAPEHTHDGPRSVYVVSGGLLELVGTDGSTNQLEVLRGQAIWRPAETHSVQNIGPTQVILVETELRGGADP